MKYTRFKSASEMYESIMFKHNNYYNIMKEIYIEGDIVSRVIRLYNIELTKVHKYFKKTKDCNGFILAIPVRYAKEQFSIGSNYESANYIKNLTLEKLEPLAKLGGWVLVNSDSYIDFIEKFI